MRGQIFTYCFEVNAQNARNYINEAGEEIARLISQKMARSSTLENHRIDSSAMHGAAQREGVNRERRSHEQRLTRLLEGLTRFESNVEAVRSSVLTSNRKLRMSEVESLTEGLTQIGREAATLKTEFPPIQTAIESQIKADMERIVREEKYIRDQTAAVDQSLRRCKALANIMVTMKKLAMVQDPTIQRSKKVNTSSISKQVTVIVNSTHHKAESANGPLPSAHPSQFPPNAANAPAPQLNPTQRIEAHSNSNSQPVANGYQQNGIEIAAPYTPNISKNAPELLPPLPQQSNTSPAAELDNVLEEVAPTGIPPRPPSRYSVQDVRMKFQRPPDLPEQIKSLIDEVARRASPGPDANERRLDLEERQERLAEKQRQLRSQFQQLQQMTPLP
ncbi:hypothetical protein ANCCAN_07934 [Ancylostoma caninum]|uniref:Actin interacting protein 3-like C-terminal domain-containing protein n=1 Tax=Ancylostoma caninum TaxID=29170 RepID=A0A368GR37_ANCCA|nr:hypothetical protein ANCCAN_07934 [Ancylostoma caninum]